MVTVLHHSRPMLDVIVVGGGPAGLSAALMLGRCRRRVLVCDAGEPRNARSAALHGYLTRDGVAPLEFNHLGRQELEPYGVRFLSVRVAGATRGEGHFTVQLADGRSESARFLLLATGVRDELPGVPGLEACYGRSVFHCPYCDGWEWRDRRLIALGPPSKVAGLALALKTWSNDVVLCSNGGRVRAPDVERLVRQGVAIRTDRLERIDQRDGLAMAVVFRSGRPEPAEAIFFTTGQHPQCDLARRLGCAFTRRGVVKTGTLSETNVPGVFVAGDASRDAQFVVVAAAEGVKAAMAINQALQRAESGP
jgi:thioredoxin reductase